MAIQFERELDCTDRTTVTRSFTVMTLLYTPTEVSPVNSASCNDVLNRCRPAGSVRLCYGVCSVCVCFWCHMLLTAAEFDAWVLQTTC
jgi:hypothetical protein